MMKLAWCVVVMWCSIAFAADQNQDWVLGEELEKGYVAVDAEFDMTTQEGAFVAYQAGTDKWKLGRITQKESSSYIVEIQPHIATLLSTTYLRNIKGFAGQTT